ncbi:MAG: hypothetical protein P8R54_19325 [Myxococcota bacterium]|nr:hypothetical protein [Myxococcota bacterium]
MSARPVTLQRAVDGMAAPKGDHPATPLRIAAQRDRLLAIPVAELAHYRINARALAILPILAVEITNTPLRQRVIALSIAQAEQLTWSTLARLLPWIYMVDDFRRKIHSRARKSPPPTNAPRWLRVHWRSALGRESPAAALAEVGLSTEHTLARLLAHLQIPYGTPLATAVLSAVVHSRDDTWLAAQPFTETLRFIESSGAAPSVRVPLVRRILARYASRIRDPDELEGAMLELMLLARQQLAGWPRSHSGAWSGLPAGVLLACRWCQRRDELIEVFGVDDFRVAGWIPWLRYIERIERAGPVVGVTIGTRIFAEPADAPTICRVYSPPTWRDFMRRQADSELPLPPPRPEVRLSGDQESRPEIDRFILDRCGLGLIHTQPSD